MPPRPEWLRLPPTEAIAAFRQRLAIPNANYSGLDAVYHDWVFSLAGVHSADILESVQFLLDEAIAEGNSFETFNSQFDRLVARKGWDANGRRRQIIFDQNVRKAYGDGRWVQMNDPDVLAANEYRIWRHRDSPNPRPEHLKLHNKAIRADHPFWKAISFPCGWGCKCGAYAASADFVKRGGYEILENPPDPNTIVDSGFRRASPAKERSEMVNAGLSRLQPEMRARVKAKLKREGKLDNRRTIAMQEILDSIRADGRIWVPPSRDRKGYYRNDPREAKEQNYSHSHAIKLQSVRSYTDSTKADIDGWKNLVRKHKANNPDADPKLLAKLQDCKNVAALIDPLMQIKDLPGSPDYRFVGLNYGGKLASAAVVRTDPNTDNSLYVEALVTSPYTNFPDHALYDRDLGYKTMREIIRESNASGHDGRVTLDAVPGAMRFYSKLGFEANPNGKSDRSLILEPERALELMQQRTDSANDAQEIREIEREVGSVFCAPSDYVPEYIVSPIETSEEGLHTDDNSPVQKIIRLGEWDIGLQYLPGDERHGKKLRIAYGHIRNHVGEDGMALDCYVGSNLNSPKIFRVKQLNRDGQFDEYKFMLGFDSRSQAKKAFLSAMPKEFYGSIQLIEAKDLEEYRS